MTRIVFWYILAFALGLTLSAILAHLLFLSPVSMPIHLRYGLSIVLGFGISWNLLAPEDL